VLMCLWDVIRQQIIEIALIDEDKKKREASIRLKDKGVDLMNSNQQDKEWIRYIISDEGSNLRRIEGLESSIENISSNYFALVKCFEDSKNSIYWKEFSEHFHDYISTLFSMHHWEAEKLEDFFKNILKHKENKRSSWVEDSWPSKPTLVISND